MAVEEYVRKCEEKLQKLVYTTGLLPILSPLFFMIFLSFRSVPQFFLSLGCVEQTERERFLGFPLLKVAPLLGVAGEPPSPSRRGHPCVERMFNRCIGQGVSWFSFPCERWKVLWSRFDKFDDLFL